MNETKLMFSLGELKHFTNHALGLSYEKGDITGFELIVPLLEASSHNTYVETVSNKADTLHDKSEKSMKSMMTWAYLNYIKRISEKFNMNKEPVMLAFDYTDEDFYGDVQGIEIHGWTRKDAVTGKFKFLTCSIVSADIPIKIPLISIPIHVGHYKSNEVLYCLSLVEKYIGKIKLILFDRGFHNNDLMFELDKKGYPFLIFIPKKPEYKKLMEELEEGITMFVHNFKINKDKSTYGGEAYLAFLKQVYDKKIDKNLDWIFMTNIKRVVLGNIIRTYKKRWGIENQFKIQDDANIKSKSTRMKIRYFLFLYEQMLQVMWYCFYKDECSFKKFLIAMAKMSRKWTKTKDA